MTWEDDYVFSCADLELTIEARSCVAEGDMVALISSVSNICNSKFLWGLNGLRGSLGGINGNDYSVPPHKKLLFFCVFLFIFLSVKSPRVHMNNALEISLCFLSKKLD